MGFGKIVGGVVVGLFLYDILDRGIGSLIGEIRHKVNGPDREKPQRSDAYKGDKNKKSDGSIQNKIGFGEN